MARAAVFESGSGRTTVGRADVPVHPARFYVGLSSGTTQVKAGDELVVDGVTVDWEGQLVTDVPLVSIREPRQAGSTSTTHMARTMKRASATG